MMAPGAPRKSEETQGSLRCPRRRIALPSRVSPGSSPCNLRSGVTCDPGDTNRDGRVVAVCRPDLHRPSSWQVESRRPQPPPPHLSGAISAVVWCLAPGACPETSKHACASWTRPTSCRAGAADQHSTAPDLRAVTQPTPPSAKRTHKLRESKIPESAAPSGGLMPCSEHPSASWR